MIPVEPTNDPIPLEEDVDSDQGTEVPEPDEPEDEP